MFHVREGEAKYRESNEKNTPSFMDKEFSKGEP